MYNSVFFWRYGDLDLLKAIARNVTGHLIRTSLGRFQDLGICNMTDMPTINTRDCGNASSLMIKTTLWSVYSVRIEEEKNQDIILGRPRTSYGDVLRVNVTERV